MGPWDISWNSWRSRGRALSFAGNIELMLSAVGLRSLSWISGYNEGHICQDHCHFALGEPSCVIFHWPCRLSLQMGLIAAQIACTKTLLKINGLVPLGASAKIRTVTLPHACVEQQQFTLVQKEARQVVQLAEVLQTYI